MRLFHRLVLTVAFALAAAPLAAQPSVSTPSTDAAQSAWNDALLQAARTDGDAQSAMAIARTLHWGFSIPPHVLEASAQIRRDALARAPTDPAVLALAYDEATAQEHLAWRPVIEAAAADNALYALWLLKAEDADKDPAAVARWIALAARAPRLEGNTLALTRGLMARLEHVDFGPGAPNDASTRRTFAFSVAMSMAVGNSLMGSSALMRTCKSATGVVRDDCRALGKLWREQADTALDAILANGIRYHAADSTAERAAIDADKRQVSWLLRQLSANDVEKFFASAEGLRYIDTHLARGELVALRELAEARGTPEPPAGWKP